MRSVLLAIACAAGVASAACPTWVGQNSPYAVGTVVSYNGQNFKVTRTLDNGWIAPSDTWFWSATTEVCGAASTSIPTSDASLNAVSKVSASPSKVMYVTIEGTKQGRFKGESVREAHKNKLEAWNLGHAISSPRDAATGQASGRRQHGPLTITKAWGAATPQIFQALVTNEVLKSVLIEHLQTTPEGMEEVRGTIKLTNATVSNVVRSTDADGRIIEAVSFTYQRIELEDKPGKTAAFDDWGR